MTKKKKLVNTKPITQTELMEGLFVRAYLDFAKRYAEKRNTDTTKPITKAQWKEIINPLNYR